MNATSFTKTEMPHNPGITCLRTILLPCLGTCLCACGAGSSPLLPPWITTNILSANELSARYLGENDMTPSVTTNVPHASAYSNSCFRLLIRHREALVMRITAKGFYEGKLMANYDVRPAGRHISNAYMPDEEIRRLWQTNQPLFTILYYRGRIFDTDRHSYSDDWITVFCSEDRRRIVFVRDLGPICFSDDSGTSWNTIIQPGHYECTLSTSPKGSVVVAALDLSQYSSANSTDQEIVGKNWYSVVSAADGSKLVLTGGTSQSAPVLSITSSGNSINLSWPGSYTEFALQRTADLTMTHWMDVTNSPKTLDSQFVVTLPITETNCFFRLEHLDPLNR
jgi:hypothetical protein